jgi:phytoene dehydrogenase-like protein
LLGGRYTNGDIDRRFKEWKPVKPMVMVNLGVDRTLDDEPWLQIIRLKNPVIVGETRVKALTMRTFNYSDRFAPLGKTVVQVSFESEWEFWKEIGRDSRTYQHEKSRIAEEISDRLEEIFPGFYGQIEMTDVVTPITTWRYTRNYKAAYMGWVPTWEVMSAPALRTAPGLDSLYIAGQWSMGGGALPCLYSGRQVIQLICHKDGKPFISSRP